MYYIVISWGATKVMQGTSKLPELVNMKLQQCLPTRFAQPGGRPLMRDFAVPRSMVCLQMLLMASFSVSSRL